jgi:hypothetical protein
MLVKGIGSAALIVLVVAGLGGCREGMSTPALPKGSEVSLPAAAAMDASGGQAAWKQCQQFETSGVVTAYRENGGVYLTEYTFRVSPWSHTLSISAREPRCNYVWQLVGHRFLQVEGTPSLDVSPLRRDYQDCAEAVLEIMTAPVRLSEWGAQPTGQVPPLMIGGQPYRAIEVGSPTGVERVYYRDEGSSRIDMIWLADADRTHFVLVRGYDYAPISTGGVYVPMKIELFRSDPSRRIGPRFALVDMRRMG